MKRKLTRITPLIDGYAVVVVQKDRGDGKPSEFVGCFLQTPENPDDGPFMLLAEVMNAYLKLTSKSQLSDYAALTSTFDRVTNYQ